MRPDYFIVHRSILPDFFDAVIECKKLVEGNRMSVSDAAKKCGISRGTYYKYKDYVSYDKREKEKIAILSIRVEDRKGILSAILNTIFAYNGNVNTINQNVPINDLAFIILSVTLDDLSIDILELLKMIRKLEGVKLVEILAVQ